MLKKIDLSVEYVKRDCRCIKILLTIEFGCRFVPPIRLLVHTYQSATFLLGIHKRTVITSDEKYQLVPVL